MPSRSGGPSTTRPPTRIAPFVGVSNDALLHLRRSAERRPLFVGLERSLPKGLSGRDTQLFRAFRQRYDRLAGLAPRLSLERLCERIQAHVPSFVIFESAVGSDPDKRDYIVSNEKIERTGFKPAFSLDDGIREMVKAYPMLRHSRYSNV